MRPHFMHVVTIKGSCHPLQCPNNSWPPKHCSSQPRGEARHCSESHFTKSHLRCSPTLPVYGSPAAWISPTGLTPLRRCNWKEEFHADFCLEKQTNKSHQNCCRKKQPLVTLRPKFQTQGTLLHLRKWDNWKLGSNPKVLRSGVHNLLQSWQTSVFLHATPVLNNKNKHTALVSCILKEQPHHVASPSRCWDRNQALESPKRATTSPFGLKNKQSLSVPQAELICGAQSCRDKTASAEPTCAVGSAQLNSHCGVHCQGTGWHVLR